MTRILADLPDDDLKWLDQRAAEQGKPRSEVLSDIFAWYYRKLEAAKCAS